MSLPDYYFVAVMAAVLIGVSKGGFAASFNMVVMPMLALATDPVHAAVIMLPVMCVIDLFAIWTYGKKADFGLYKLLLAGSCIGLGVGALTFTTMNADAMRVLLGVIALFFGGRGLWQYLHTSKGKVLPRWVGFLAGAGGGFTSFITHAGSPPIQMYLLPMRMQKTLLHATSVTLFATMNFLKLGIYGSIGQLSTGRWLESAALLPWVPVGFFLGVYLHKKVSDRWFYLLSYIALIFMGFRLLYTGSNALWFAG